MAETQAQSAPTETEAQDSETPLQEAEDDPVGAGAEEEPETPAAPKRGRPKGSKDAQPRTRTRPEPHTPSKQYLESDDSAGAMRHLEAVMQSAQQQEVLRKHEMYRSWLPY